MPNENQKTSTMAAFQKRKAIDLSSTELVTIGRLNESSHIPVLIKPAFEEVDLEQWARANLALIDSILLKAGAILFRGFKAGSIARFESFAKATCSELMDYSEPSTPRTEVSEKVYTSTEYPPAETLPLHNEMSYSHVWPMRVWLYCVKPADQGGETPIADSRQIFQLLDPALRQRFIDKRVLYVRNYEEGIGLSWQRVFHTDSRETLEEYCRSNNIGYEWLDGNRLRTRHVRQAIAAHPKTGETVWFNQAHIHNVMNLSPSFRDELLSVARDKEFPLDINSFYGDGTPLEQSVFDEIHGACWEASVKFPWQEGDLIMLDNMLVAHSRLPFAGTRRIVVAMADPYSQPD